MARPSVSWWLGISLLVVTIAIAVFAVIERSDKGTSLAHVPQAMPVTNVETVSVAAGPLHETLRAVGTLEANESVMIRPEIAGLITRVLFAEGQSVEKGMALIELDDAELQAHLAEAAAQLKIARQTYDRMMQLTGTHNPFISEQQIDQAISGRAIAEANHALYRTRLAKTTIRAPFSGYVGIRRVSPGDYVQPGQDLVNLEDMRTLKIDFKIPETFLGKVSIGQEVFITTDADPAHPRRGKIYVLDPRVDVSSRAIHVRAQVSNIGETLRPGLFANVKVMLGEEAHALLIPEEAVIQERQKMFVYRIEAHTARWTEVGLGLRQDGRVQVLNGLKEGETIVRAGHHKIKDGTVVATR